MSDMTGAVEILLVEDNPADAELCIHALKGNNLANRLLWVKDGPAALDALKASVPSGKPKVVLLDLRLPKLDGLEVLRWIRSTDEFKAMPVVVLTSSKEDKDLDAAYRLGANSFISKPVEFDEFNKVITSLGFYWLVVNRSPQ